MGGDVAIVNLLLHKLTFIRWNRRSAEEASDVFGESFTNPLIQQLVEMLLIIRDRDRIVVGILHVIMVRNVVIDRAIPRFRDVLGALRVPFLLVAAVHALFNNGPPHIVIGQFALLDRPRG